MQSMIERLRGYERYCDEAMLSEHFRKMIEEASKAIKWVDSDGLETENPALILLDVREPEEFASGYIPGKNVLTIPRGKLEFMAIEQIAKPYGQNAPIVRYCLKGPRGALAAMQLVKLGFENVMNLKGGIRGWVESGRPIRNYLGELTLCSSQ